MATVVITPTALADLDRLLRSHSLPATTRDRVRVALRPLADFPLLGAQLSGRWSRFRFVLGPWPWMILVYAYREEADEVAVVAIHDARSGESATSER